MGGAAVGPKVPTAKGREVCIRQTAPEGMSVSLYNTVTPLGWPLSFWMLELYSSLATLPFR